VVVDCDYDFLVARIAGAAARLVVAKVPELEADGGVHDQDACGTEKEGGCAEHPGCAVAAVGADPAGALAGSVVVPGAGVGEEGGGVEEVAEEGGGEECGGQAGGGFADLVHVELGKARTEVEEGAGPGEDLAGDFGGGG
jgi:hypothetical protein